MPEVSQALEISPKSLFGRHPYPYEQRLIRDFITEVDKSVVFVSPLSVGVPFPLEKLPPDFRRNKIKEHLSKSREILGELGV